MKLRIKAEGHKFTIPFPNGLLFNGAVSKIASKAIKNSANMDITPAQIKSLGGIIKESKKLLKGQPLLYVKSAHGEEVTITL